MVEPVSIPEAAEALDLSPARVRAMAADGQLSAAKLGDRWFVERAALERRRKDGSHEGRRFSPRNAWALLRLASGEEVDGIDPSSRSRLKRALALEGLKRIAPRLGYRAEVLRFRSHPGELRHLQKDLALVLSGVSAEPRRYEMVAGREVDGYIKDSELKRFVSRHALVPSGPDGNVRLRLVPAEAWQYLEGLKLAPPAAVALDLAEDFDPRSASAGRKALAGMDRKAKRSFGRSS
jgi:hypothetical protein